MDIEAPVYNTEILVYNDGQGEVVIAHSYMNILSKMSHADLTSIAMNKLDELLIEYCVDNHGLLCNNALTVHHSNLFIMA